MLAALLRTACSTDLIPTSGCCLPSVSELLQLLAVLRDALPVQLHWLSSLCRSRTGVSCAAAPLTVASTPSLARDAVAACACKVCLPPRCSGALSCLLLCHALACIALGGQNLPPGRVDVRLAAACGRAATWQARAAVLLTTQASTVARGKAACSLCAAAGNGTTLLAKTPRCTRSAAGVAPSMALAAAPAMRKLWPSAWQSAATASVAGTCRPKKVPMTSSALTDTMLCQHARHLDTISNATIAGPQAHTSIARQGSTWQQVVAEVGLPAVALHKMAECCVTNGGGCKANAFYLCSLLFWQAMQEVQCAQLCDSASQRMSCSVFWNMLRASM